MRHRIFQALSRARTGVDHADIRDEVARKVDELGNAVAALSSLPFACLPSYLPGRQGGRAPHYSHAPMRVRREALVAGGCAAMDRLGGEPSARASRAYGARGKADCGGPDFRSGCEGRQALRALLCAACGGRPRAHDRRLPLLAAHPPASSAAAEARARVPARAGAPTVPAPRRIYSAPAGGVRMCNVRRPAYLDRTRIVPAALHVSVTG